MSIGIIITYRLIERKKHFKRVQDKSLFQSEDFVICTPRAQNRSRGPDFADNLQRCFWLYPELAHPEDWKVPQTSRSQVSPHRTSRPLSGRVPRRRHVVTFPGIAQSKPRGRRFLHNTTRNPVTTYQKQVCSCPVDSPDRLKSMFGLGAGRRDDGEIREGGRKPSEGSVAGACDFTRTSPNVCRHARVFLSEIGASFQVRVSENKRCLIGTPAILRDGSFAPTWHTRW